MCLSTDLHPNLNILCIVLPISQVWNNVCYSSTNNQICHMYISPTHQIVSPTLCDQHGPAQPEAGQLNSTDLQDPDPLHTASPVVYLRWNVLSR
jgi:hypothetical protein